MKRTIIPGVVDGHQQLCCLPGSATALEAAIAMRDQRVGAVMVVEGGELRGIVTERDLVTRLLAEGHDPARTCLAAIMTPGPMTLKPDDTAKEALDRMESGRYRHLPVLDGERIVGMVSIRDLFDAVRRSLEEDLHAAETLIYGEQYGMATH